MIKLSDIFDVHLLAQRVEEGYVRKQWHPNMELAILNYTEKAAFDSVWDEVTLNCRGLIYEHLTSNVVARPFKKFMNHGQAGAAIFDLNDPVEVTDKKDGSLGILYRNYYDLEWAIATRGSFTSEQAIHATEVFRTKYSNWHPDRSLTWLFEIIYPENRIVLNYNDFDDIVLLGAVEIHSGRTFGPSTLIHAPHPFPGSVTEVFPYTTFAEALEAEPRINAEGYVVHNLRTDERLKIKQEDYVALHKLVTGLSERTVWEQLVAGKSIREIIEPLPDEFHDWVDNVAMRLNEEVFEAKSDIRASYLEIIHNLFIKYGKDWGRKEFALEIMHRVDKWAMFMMLDKQDERLNTELWKRIKPDAFRTPAKLAHTEDTA